MSKVKLPLSIIIPCADDIRIKDCIESIDVNVEIVVVLNGATKEVKEIARAHKVTQVLLKERNLAKALNVGIKRAKNARVILIDSDCIFHKGAIEKIYKALKSNFVAKGKVIFESNGFFSKIVAETRDYVYYNPPKPYNPFLGIRKDVNKLIGGHYFDEHIHWTEDADLSSRLTRSGVKVKYVFSARVYHPPLTLKYDLRSAFRYGIGKRIRVLKGKTQGVGTHFQNIPDLISKKGAWSGVYYFFWNISFTLGYLYQLAYDPYKVKSLLTTTK